MSTDVDGSAKEIEIASGYTFPNPLQIELGDGRLAVSPFKASDGWGIMFTDTGSSHKVGDPVPELETETRLPAKDEVYILCKNAESAAVLMEMAVRAYILAAGLEFTDESLRRCMDLILEQDSA